MWVCGWLVFASWTRLSAAFDYHLLFSNLPAKDSKRRLWKWLWIRHQQQPFRQWQFFWAICWSIETRHLFQCLPSVSRLKAPASINQLFAKVVAVEMVWYTLQLQVDGRNGQQKRENMLCDIVSAPLSCSFPFFPQFQQQHQLISGPV